MHETMNMKRVYNFS